MVREWPSHSVTLATDGKEGLLVSSGSAEYRVVDQAASAADRARRSTPTQITLPQAALAQMLKGVAPAMPESPRARLPGVVFIFAMDELRLMAANNEAMAHVRYPVEGLDSADPFLLPLKSVRRLRRSLGKTGFAEITRSKSKVAFLLPSGLINEKLADQEDIKPIIQELLAPPETVPSLSDRMQQMNILPATPAMESLAPDCPF